MKTLPQDPPPQPKPPSGLRALRILSAALMPMFFILTSVRLMLNPSFIRLEYAMPAFPEDPYGFDLRDRLTWSQKSLEYLLNEEGRDFLGDLRFDDGSAVFNERELRHMDDVKNLVRLALSVWVGTGVVLLACLALVWRIGGSTEIHRTLRQGAMATFGVMIFLGLFLALSFWSVFVAFHRIFFEGDTWLFYYSDTLIRLFPQRFWQDVFTFLAVGTAILAGAAWGLGRLISRRPKA
jgi:integral membrane protein (TIGR01906 family)